MLHLELQPENEALTAGLDDIAAGRSRPAREVFSELRAKHGIPITVDGQPEFVIQEVSAYQRLLDIPAEADAGEGISQGLEELHQGKGRPVADFIEEFRATHGIPPQHPTPRR